METGLAAAHLAEAHPLHSRFLCTVRRVLVNSPEKSGCGCGAGRGLSCPVQHVLMLLVSRLRTPELDRAT